jgi:hypothetical protein
MPQQPTLSDPKVQTSILAPVQDNTVAQAIESTKPLVTEGMRMKSTSDFQDELAGLQQSAESTITEIQDLENKKNDLISLMSSTTPPEGMQQMTPVEASNAPAVREYEKRIQQLKSGKKAGRIRPGAYDDLVDNLTREYAHRYKPFSSDFVNLGALAKGSTSASAFSEFEAAEKLAIKRTEAEDKLIDDLGLPSVYKTIRFLRHQTLKQIERDNVYKFRSTTSVREFVSNGYGGTVSKVNAAIARSREPDNRGMVKDPKALINEVNFIIDQTIQDALTHPDMEQSQRDAQVDALEKYRERNIKLIEAGDPAKDLEWRNKFREQSNIDETYVSDEAWSKLRDVVGPEGALKAMDMIMHADDGLRLWAKNNLNLPLKDLLFTTKNEVIEPEDQDEEGLVGSLTRLVSGNLDMDYPLDAKVHHVLSKVAGNTPESKKALDAGYKASLEAKNPFTISQFSKDHRAIAYAKAHPDALKTKVHSNLGLAKADLIMAVNKIKARGLPKSPDSNGVSTGYSVEYKPEMNLLVLSDPSGDPVEYVQTSKGKNKAISKEASDYLRKKRAVARLYKKEFDLSLSTISQSMMGRTLKPIAHTLDVLTMHSNLLAGDEEMSVSKVVNDINEIFNPSLVPEATDTVTPKSTSDKSDSSKGTGMFPVPKEQFGEFEDGTTSDESALQGLLISIQDMESRWGDLDKEEIEAFHARVQQAKKLRQKIEKGEDK